MHEVASDPEGSQHSLCLLQYSQSKTTRTENKEEYRYKYFRAFPILELCLFLIT
jgi:hypothetical protein